MLTPLDDLPTWRAESGASAPRRVVAADDTMSADTAHRLACEGTGLLWQGDFHNARQLLQALARRHARKPKKNKVPAADITPVQAFNAHRMALSQRARLLAMVIVPLEGDYTVALRRAPDLKQACTDAWCRRSPMGENNTTGQPVIASEAKQSSAGDCFAALAVTGAVSSRAKRGDPSLVDCFAALAVTALSCQIACKQRSSGSASMTMPGPPPKGRSSTRR